LTKDEVKVEKSAPADGAAPKENAPESGVVETPKEEAKKVDASPEAAEAQKEVSKMEVELKSDEIVKTISKIDETISKFDTRLSDIEKRINALEEQPMPSKVASAIVVSKSDTASTELSKEDQEKLDKINKRLAELNDLRKNNMEAYQAKNLGMEAWGLLNERDSIKSH
jgi:hypothetical protein